MIALSGRHGFVGSHLHDLLQTANIPACALARPQAGTQALWGPQLADCRTVIHLAALAHRMGNQQEAAAAYRAANLDLTINLAQQAAEAGCLRFLFVSTMKVLGERSPDDGPLLPEHTPAPADPYAQAKAAAEEWLLANASGLGLELAIVRPPLVYGEGVKGNFLRLLQLARLRLPLPLGSVKAQRSLVYVGNLVALLAHLASNQYEPSAEVLHITDDQHPTTPELLHALGERMHKRQRLLPIPVSLLRALGKVTGRSADIQRLVTPMLVDDGATRRLPGWQTPFTMATGLDRTVDWFIGTAT